MIQRWLHPVLKSPPSVLEHCLKDSIATHIIQNKTAISLKDCSDFGAVLVWSTGGWQDCVAASWSVTAPSSYNRFSKPATSRRRMIQPRTQSSQQQNPDSYFLGNVREQNAAIDKLAACQTCRSGRFTCAVAGEML